MGIHLNAKYSRLDLISSYAIRSECDTFQRDLRSCHLGCHTEKY